MGRGRAKAKQTKVARRLKYYSPDTDLTALEQELKGSDSDTYASRPPPAPVDDEEFADTYRRGSHSPNGGSRATSSEAEDLDGDKKVAAKPPPPPSITPGSWVKKQS
ncbi:MAG: DUF3073 domain-containing protein [Ornithinimicrobium sp.]